MNNKKGGETMEYKEIFRLKELLEKANIPFEFREFFDGYQLCYPVIKENERVCSVIEHMGSYGHEIDRLEIMGLLFPKEREVNSVKGCLSATRVFFRIKMHYEGRAKECGLI